VRGRIGTFQPRGGERQVDLDDLLHADAIFAERGWIDRPLRSRGVAPKKVTSLWAIPFFNDDPPGSLRPTRLENIKHGRV
jgi:hypothetical protein